MTVQELSGVLTGSLPLGANLQVSEGDAIGLDGGTPSRSRPLVAGDAFMGFARRAVADSGAAGSSHVDVYDLGGRVVDVTGLTSAAQVGDSVYASGPTGLTLTEGSNSLCGRVARFVSSGRGVVRFESRRVSSVVSSTLTQNLVLLLDEASTLLTDGFGVTSWADRSGAGVVAALTQDTDSRKPTGTTTVNSLRAVEFDALNQEYLDAAAAAAESPITVYVVAQTAQGDGYALAIDTDSAAHGRNLRLRSAFGALFLTIETGEGSSQSTAFESFTDAQPHVFGFVTSGPSSRQAFINETFSTESTTPALTPDTPTTTRVGGPASDSGAAYFDGAMCEVRVYSVAHTAEQIEEVRAFLSAKWGTP